jgi:hypothetical protein
MDGHHLQDLHVGHVRGRLCDVQLGGRAVGLRQAARS